MDINSIGKLIKSERVRRGMTQEELGEKIGVGKAQICKIENGSAMNIKTISKAVDGLDMSVEVNLTQERILSTKIAGFMVACINDFALKYDLSIKEASNYLKRYNGLAFLIQHYDVQHLLSVEDSVQDLAIVCYNNGGGLQ